MSFVSEVHDFDLHCDFCGYEVTVPVTDEPVPVAGHCPHCLRTRGAVTTLARRIPQVYDYNASTIVRWPGRG